MVFIVTLGLLCGSFANACIYRWPRGISINKPARSFCPWCRQEIRWYDNIPILSFLCLAGKCRRCRSPISWRYPLVEATVPTVWVVVFLWLRAGTELNIFFLTSIFFLLFVMIVTTLTDLDWKIIPDEATYALIAIGLASSPWNVFHESAGGFQRFLDAVRGFIAGGGSLWIISVAGRAMTGKDVMGGGDVKLLAGFGTVLGWKGAVVSLLLGSLIGSVVALTGLLTRKLSRHQYIPFGPFLNAGGFLALFLMAKFSDALATFW